MRGERDGPNYSWLLYDVYEVERSRGWTRNRRGNWSAQIDSDPIKHGVAAAISFNEFKVQGCVAPYSYTPISVPTENVCLAEVEAWFIIIEVGARCPGDDVQGARRSCEQLPGETRVGEGSRDRSLRASRVREINDAVSLVSMRVAADNEGDVVKSEERCEMLLQGHHDRIIRRRLRVDGRVNVGTAVADSYQEGARSSVDGSKVVNEPVVLDGSHLKVVLGRVREKADGASR